MATEASTEQPKVVLYWLEKSRSQRILWLLEELNINYEVKVFHRDPKTHFAPPELKEVHALGKSPVISITPTGSSKPVIIAESSNIIEYLTENFGNGSTLLPKKYKEGEEGKIGGETEEYLRYRYFLHYGEGTLMPYLLLTLIAQNIKNAPVPFFIRPITNRIAGTLLSSFINPNLTSNFEFLESQLDSSPSGGKYLCGPNLTGADILVSFPLLAAHSRAGLTKEKYPKLASYVEMMQELPKYKKAVEKIVEIDGKFEAI